MQKFKQIVLKTGKKNKNKPTAGSANGASINNSAYEVFGKAAELKP